MNVKLTPHAAELLKAVRARRLDPIELIVEPALETLAREECIEPGNPSTADAQRQAVSEMLEFVKKNRVRLEPGVLVKDLIHEGHRV